jgi:hypothetical protein
MPAKTYTRQVLTLFTREEMASLLKEAHNACKAKVKPRLHKIGRTRQRTVVYRERAEYLNCIKEYINNKIAERVKAVGAA